MEYTVGRLAKTAGVTRRALHHYDEIGLLCPARTTSAGYRVYGEAEVTRLQQILFYTRLTRKLSQDNFQARGILPRTPAHRAGCHHRS